MGKRDHRRRGAKTGATARARRSETVDVYVNLLDDRSDLPGYSQLAANATLADPAPQRPTPGRGWSFGTPTVAGGGAVVDIDDPCRLDRLTTPARPG